MLGDTQKMVADLKERVQQVELEREKEKQAMRKQMLDMRSSIEKERQESRRKMSEVISFQINSPVNTLRLFLDFLNFHAEVFVDHFIMVESCRWPSYIYILFLMKGQYK